MLDAGVGQIEIEGTGTEEDQSVITVDQSKEAGEKQDRPTVEGKNSYRSTSVSSLHAVVAPPPGLVVVVVVVAPPPGLVTVVAPPPSLATVVATISGRW
ncbi:hypothetical protein LWI28_025980 [Acer negundo]|uniref:Uncharacterized protein n=1 Tax=Acer negundo TaxID=4023 RepID=A0AAD5NYP5_ACENE|nr:hypothetical protein LWI28_025980 [Acer negundo]